MNKRYFKIERYNSIIKETYLLNFLLKYGLYYKNDFKLAVGR